MDFGAKPAPPNWVYRARLSRAVDGDSFWAYFDRGFRDTSEREVRLLGLNCPEMGTVAGKEAAAYTALWISLAIQREGTWPFLISSHKLEKFGRWLAVVWRKDDLVSLNEALLSSGHAVSYLPH